MRGEGAVPFLPAATPGQRRFYSDILSHQPGHQAIGRRIDFQIDIEPVVIGHCIKLQHQPVALQCPAGRIDDRAPVSNADLALERCNLLLAGYRFGENDAADFQPADIDIKVGQ